MVFIARARGDSLSQREMREAEPRFGISVGSPDCVPGVLERVEEDGAVIVRLGDSLVQVETSGPAPVPGSSIRINAPVIEAWPVFY